MIKQIYWWKFRLLFTTDKIILGLILWTPHTFGNWSLTIGFICFELEITLWQKLEVGGALNALSVALC